MTLFHVVTWMALSLVQSRLVDSDSTEEFFPRASVQVEAIMRKLFAENAFVKCLRGYTQGKNTRSKCQETIVSLKMLHLQNAPIQAAHHVGILILRMSVLLQAVMRFRAST